MVDEFKNVSFYQNSDRKGFWAKKNVARVLRKTRKWYPKYHMRKSQRDPDHVEHAKKTSCFYLLCTWFRHKTKRNLAQKKKSNEKKFSIKFNWKSKRNSEHESKIDRSIDSDRSHTKLIRFHWKSQRANEPVQSTLFPWNANTFKSRSAFYASAVSVSSTRST